MAKAAAPIKFQGPDAAINSRIRNYIFLNVLLILAGLVLFNMLGLIDLRKVILPLLSRTPAFNKVLNVGAEDPYLLSRAERSKEVYTLRVLEDSLKEKEKTLKVKETSLKTLEDKLAADRDEIELLRKDFEDKKNAYNNYKKNIGQQAVYIEGMRPEDAVARLQEMDDMTIVDIFREMESRAQAEGRTSTVSYLLSLFNPKRASVLQKKMLHMDE
jgi:flagellar protein FlbB